MLYEARPCAPSPVDMLRVMAASFISLANCGKCSLILVPGGAVSISWYGPLSVVTGLRSKVALWLGPPAIQSRTQALGLTLVWAARAARTFMKPDIEKPVTPAAASFRASRRVRPWFSFNMAGGIRLGWVCVWG